MIDYFRIIYVNTRSSAGAGVLPEDVKNIRDWSWQQSALVRWSCIETEALANSLNAVSLAVLDWSSKNASEAKSVGEQIRNLRPDLPILIIASDPGRSPARQTFLSKYPPAFLVKDITRIDSIAEAFSALKLDPTHPSLALHPDLNDLAITSFIEWAGRERLPLPLTIQKFFPSARKAFIMPVGGGWSEAKLCRLIVDTDEKPYFLKFFTERSEYISELSQHEKAKAWLRDATVDLKLVPEIEGGILAQSEVFPDTGPPFYPICYESASSRERPRETLKDLYRKLSNDSIEHSFARLLAILASGQLAGSNIPTEPPWSLSDERGFRLTSKTRVSVLDTISDLAIYGPPTCYGDRRRWTECCEAIQKLVYPLALPKWLSEPWPVIIGHIHGDPNPRNCLVNPDDPEDLRLIDCGGYRDDGRLITDLALIERDIKLVLMGTESDAGNFFDLDATQIPLWCSAESDSISRRLNYTSVFAPVSPKSINRAYGLIGQIRERARHLSGSRDSEGRHYFAALLYWTLDILKYQAVYPTKKLLALYSAAEIIRTFD